MNYWTKNRKNQTNQNFICYGSQQVLKFDLCKLSKTFMSFYGISKSKISMFSFILFSVFDFGNTIIPFCIKYLRDIWAIDFLYCSLNYNKVLLVKNSSNALASGEYASIIILCCSQNLIVSYCQSMGWASIWLITGNSWVFFNKCSKCLFIKLLTPISLTFPSYFNSVKAFHVSSLIWAFLGSSTFSLLTPGQWISRRSK